MPPKLRRSSSSSAAKKDNKDPHEKSVDQIKAENLKKIQELAKKHDDKKSYFVNCFPSTQTKDEFKCVVCPKKPTIQYKNLKRHLQENDDHRDTLAARKDGSVNIHDKIIGKIIAIRTEKENKKDLENDNSDDNNESYHQKKAYMQFLSACFRAKLSFNQIHVLGKEIKQIHLGYGMSFLSKHNFSLDEISDVARIWGEHLMKQLQEDLQKSCYSICIDNSTLSGHTISVMQARYLKEIEIAEGITELKLQNRVIGLEYLGEKSTGDVMFGRVKKQFFEQHELIKKNFVSLVHDHHRSLTGPQIGLVKLIRDYFGKDRHVFDVEDPCHSLHLAAKDSLEALPDEVTDFITDIHSHFSWPQRKAKLNRVQKESENKELNLCHYVETRWLSLGSSLRRLLEVWTSIKKYVAEPGKYTAAQKKALQNFKILLEDSIFRLKIVFLNGVLELINSSNTKFQDQGLEIQQLPLEMARCIRAVSVLFIKSQHLPHDISELKKSAWEANSSILKSTEEFLSTITREFSDELKILSDLDTNEQKEFADFCIKYLKRLLKNLLSWLPIENDLFKCLDFVTIPHDTETFKDKILCFNKSFKIAEDNQITKEVNDLMNLNIDWMRISSRNSSLKLWSLIESTFVLTDSTTKKQTPKFPILSKIFRTAHALAPSSSNVEQCFSILKFLKSDLRNRLKQETLKALILFHEEFEDPSTPIIISDDLIKLYDSAKQRRNESKSLERPNPANPQPDLVAEPMPGQANGVNPEPDLVVEEPREQANNANPEHDLEEEKLPEQTTVVNLESDLEEEDVPEPTTYLTIPPSLELQSIAKDVQCDLIEEESTSAKPSKKRKDKDEVHDLEVEKPTKKKVKPNEKKGKKQVSKKIV